MKRLNRVNFTIFIVILTAIQLGLIIGLAEMQYEGLIILFLIGLTISGWILIIKRCHDFGARGGRHIVGTILIPFYIFYLMFKKGDKWINKYGQEDNKILFTKKSINIYNESLLHKSCKEGNIKEVKNIIDEGGDINIQNSIGSTPLMKAIANDKIDIVKLLLKKGIDLKITRDDGYNALLIASHFGNLQIIKLLLKYGADVNFYNKGNISALDIAKSKKYLDVIELLENNLN